jgi:hypothetical protein
VTVGAFFMRETIAARFGRLDGLVRALSLISSYIGTKCIGDCPLCLPFDLIFAIKYATDHYRCRSLSLFNATMVGLVSEWRI